jgi:spermidine synthase
MKNHKDPARFLPLLLILFAGSGFSALVYEIVWYQLLQLAIGSTAVSLGILLATFMGGLCVGSIALPRLRWAQRHPLATYAFLENLIAIFGLLVLFEIPLINRVYIAGAEHGMPGMLLRGLVAAVCMLPSTILMGASLPAIVRWIEMTPRGVSWWGLLYGSNTAGGVLGCLVAGFYLLRIHDTTIATFAAVAVNLIVAAISSAVAARTPERSGAEPTNEPAGQATATRGRTHEEPQLNRWTVYVVIALSGACALGAEVVWTRLMGMLLGNTVYVFSIILAVFLVGLAIGSGAGSLVLHRLRPRLALGWCQILLALGIAWTAYMIADSLPYWPIDPMLIHGPWQMFQLDLVRCLWAILPPTILWGASMPLACAAVAKRGADSGRTVGGVYAANTFGAIIGALGVSLVLVPWIGTQNSQRILLAVSALSALFVLAPHARSSRSKATAAWLAVSLVAAALLALRLDPVPGALIAYGRQIETFSPSSHILLTAEGRNSSVAIGLYNDGSVEIDVNGHVEATNEPFDMKLQRMVGHLPALLHPNPKSVLGIGFGAGVSAGTFTRYPTIGKITVCEIEPRIPPISARFFAKENYGVFRNPRTHIVYDDARHYLLTTTEKFDIIASDPLDVFVKGTAALYSREYFEAVKQHLNPGGIFTLYVPLWESDLRTVKSEAATFFEAFPYATAWANTRDGQGYDMVFMGQAEPLKIDLDQIEQRLNQPGYAPVAESLREVGIFSAIDLLSVYTGQRADLGRWVQGAEINRDRDLRLQYLAGWGLNSRMQDTIYRQMLMYRDLSITPFTGSGPFVQSLRAAMAVASAGPQ